MRRHLRRAWLAAALVPLLLAGCSSRPFAKKNPPPDPLLLSKTPVQAKFGTGLDPTARPDPSPPTMPAGAWATGPAARLGEPGPFQFTSEKKTAGEAAKDGEALQGVLERTADEQSLLRLETGSKVVVEGHPLLDLFEPGSTIRIEGRLLDPREPRYQADRVELIRRAK